MPATSSCSTCQPVPSWNSHWPAGVRWARSATSISASVRLKIASKRGDREEQRSEPIRTPCRFASIRPGTTRRPARSISRVPSPARSPTASSLPDATTTPSRMASASTVEPRSSSVLMRPLWTIVSGTSDTRSASGPPVPRATPAAAAASRMHAAATTSHLLVDVLEGTVRVDDPAVHDREVGLEVLDLVDGDGEVVLVEDDQVRVPARLERADLALLVHEPAALHRLVAQHLGPRQPLL